MTWERLGSAGVTSTAVNTSWKELDRVTLGSAGDTLDTGTFTAKDNIMVLCSVRNDGSSNLCDPHIRFNNDSGSNYAFRHSLDGGSDSTSTSSSSIDLGAGGNYRGEQFVVCDTNNISAQEKLITASGAFNDQYSVTTGLAPDRSEVVGKWANTSAQINRVELVNTSTGDFASGSEVVVLGYDNDEADSGTNFWQELASVELSSGSTNNFNTGAFTAKKYLMIEAYVVADGVCSPRIRVGTGGSVDTGSNITGRTSSNGGSDGTISARDDIVATISGLSTPHKITAFMVNKSDKEKLCIHESTAQNTAGAGTAPQRREGVSKYANTSAQVNIIEIEDSESSTGIGNGSYIKVYGAD